MYEYNVYLYLRVGKSINIFLRIFIYMCVWIVLYVKIVKNKK